MGPMTCLLIPYAFRSYVITKGNDIVYMWDGRKTYINQLKSSFPTGEKRNQTEIIDW